MGFVHLRLQDRDGVGEVGMGVVTGDKGNKKDQLCCISTLYVISFILRLLRLSVFHI